VPGNVVDEVASRTRPAFAQSPAGAVLFVDCDTLHASAPNESTQPRLAVLITYNAKSNRATGEPLHDGAIA